MPRGKKPHFTPEQDRTIAERYRAGETLNQIAESYGVSHVPVLGALNRQGVQRRSLSDYGWQDTPEARARIMELFDAGRSVKQIAREVRTRDCNVSRALADAGRDARYGGQNHRFKPDEARQMVAEFRAGASLAELSRRHGGSTVVVRNTLHRYGVESTYAKRRAFWTPERVKWLIAEYEAGRSQSSLAAEIGVSQGAISRRLYDLGAITHDGPRSGPNHGAWKGGRFVDAQGYVRVRVGGADVELVEKTIGGGYVLEHRLVMGRALGRPLRKSETVHHVNGNRQDNRLENLQLRQGQHGTGVVMVCADCGSRNVLHSAIG